ncbi:glutaredoxin 3 [Malonomonas rubra DSM 5091]|uniref:Glutaredoxin n=1 Tax=Malonomonas rubra DSM 5091 TaxID=1122189 RepID=A0A1M6HMI5_MALRU|nr:glutaredoxin 3 [Malonomonas rubra]SHJ23402.1 glutaredoxin 3 [Malonomonas rubra DSM 5091]
MQEIVIYSKDYCPYCHRAIALLDIKGASYKVIDVTHDKEREQEMRQRTGRTSVPQIFIGEKAIGGCDDLFALDEQGKLDPLLLQLSA